MEHSNFLAAAGSEKGSPAAPGQASLGSQDPTPHPEPRKRRLAITDGERKDLRVRRQALVQENGDWSTKEMVDFFYKKYDRVLDQSTISKSLSDRFKHLDEKDHPLHPDSKKQRKSYWPDLDAAVFAWQQQRLKTKSTVTNEALMGIARKLFQKLPQYHHVEPPKFSSGWLKGYKARYNIQNPVRHKKSGILGQAVEETELEDLREQLKIYKQEDTFNMDETALFWKLSPDATLTNESRASGKLEKAQITVTLACNATGTQKLPPWIIGKAQNPRCFAHSGVHVENFPMVWRYNGKAWMTGIMFEEYLRWFDEQTAGRKVCLLIDQLVAHTDGIIFLPSERPEGLTNTTVIFLPVKPTSFCQPLEQGIIRSWKVHYRKRWLTYMCNEYDRSRDPIKSMNVLQAIRWGIAAWDDVTPTNIRDCWIKSSLLGPKAGPRTEGWKVQVADDDEILNETMTQMEQQIESLTQQKRIKSAMNVATFVNLIEEIVEDNDDDDDLFVESLVEIYSTGGVQRDHETDEEDVIEALIEDKEALELLSRLRLYEEQQKDGDEVVISQLNKYEREIWARETG